jgi:transposase-like protein
MRWVIRYVTEFEKRWNRFARSIGSSWRVDETYISIKGKWHYLYRAVDKQGRSIDFMLRPDRGDAAAQAFFRRAAASHPHRPPRKVTLDGHVPSHRALRREQPAGRRVRVRSSKYLNNIIEQDHRAIKRRCASMKGFKSFANAVVTIAGVELAHRIYKQQYSLGRGRPPNDRSLRTDWERVLHENRLAGRESVGCVHPEGIALGKGSDGKTYLFSGNGGTDDLAVMDVERALAGNPIAEVAPRIPR